MNYKFLIYFIHFLLLQHLLFGQTINSAYNERIFTAKVKQFNEFIDRFNYVTTIEGEKIDAYFRSKVTREDYIKSLFNAEDKRLNDENYNDLISEFIDAVIKDSLTIYKYSDQITAEAKSSVNRNNKECELSIFLQQEIIDHQFVKWVITDIKAEFYNFHKSDSVYQKFIQPTSNETNFINLKRILSDKEDLSIYAYSEFKVDQLSLFFYELYHGIIKYNHVNEIVYHIKDIPGWYIQVKEFNRNTENSGWLISDLKKCDL